ncbi:MAG: dicarboxylate/amino acid:cation symporter [Gemmatimonadaceae bacterium]
MTAGRSAAWYTLAALGLGLTLGIAASATGDLNAARAASWLEPVGSMWVNAIRMTVIPLVVASLLVAVSATAPGTVGKLGGRAFLIFVLLLSAMAAITALVAPLIFSRLTIDPSAAAAIRAGVAPVTRPELPTFANWLVSLLPTNPIKAASDGAMLPLVVFTLVFGLALGRLAPELRGPIVAFFRGVAEAMSLLVRWVLTLAPIGVFALAFVLAAKLGSSVVGAVGFYVVTHSALLLVSVVLLYVVVMLFTPTPVRLFARAALPAQVVAMTTRSSMAALPAMLTSAEQALGLPRTVTSFALPLATSIFRFNQAVTWVVVALFAGKLYGVELASSQVVTIAVTSVLMSFSVPGIPSASLFIIAPFLASVGIPPEAIGVLIAVDLLPDVFKTLANVTGHLASVTVLASRAAD